jgi:hypothetical protein
MESLLETGEADERFDATIVAGLEPHAAESWCHRVRTPIIASESFQKYLDHDPTLQRITARPLVTELAHVEQALAVASDREQLRSIWTVIEDGTFDSQADDATNRLSRLYSQLYSRT